MPITPLSPLALNYNLWFLLCVVEASGDAMACRLKVVGGIVGWR